MAQLINMSSSEIYPGNIRKRRLMEYLKHHPEETSELSPKKSRIEQQEDTMGAFELENPKIKIRPFEVDLETAVEDIKEYREETWDACEMAFDNQKESVQSHPEAGFQTIRVKPFEALRQHPGKNQLFLNQNVEEALSPEIRDYENSSNKLAFAYKKQCDFKQMAMHDMYNLQKRKREEFQLLVELEELKRVAHEINELRYYLSSQAEELGKDKFEHPQAARRKNATTKNNKNISHINSDYKIAEEIIQKFKVNQDGMVEIGPNGTMVAKCFLVSLNWSLSGAALTRKILVEVFGRDTLASHTLTGRPSPAFMDCEKPLKNQLDPMKVEDIIHFMLNHTALTAKEVRSAITTKCVDENKRLRLRKSKKVDTFENEEKQINF